MSHTWASTPRASVGRWITTTTVVAAIGLLVPAQARSAEGSIQGAAIDPTGTVVSVLGMQVTLDGCGSDGLGNRTLCGASARVQPAPAGSECPDDGGELPALWDTGLSSSRSSFSSGRKQLAVSPPGPYRVCLYANAAYGFFGERVDILVASSEVLAPPAITEVQAVQLVKAALGRSFAKGAARRVDCAEGPTGTFTCKARWKRGKRKGHKRVRRAVVIVGGIAAAPVVDVVRKG